VTAPTRGAGSSSPGWTSSKIPYEGTVAQKVKAELFEFRNLLVGKEAPDIEGVDQDGQRFKLSDYKGQVVLIDFWHQF
jgi:cytochrome oxidase Cu insertion factor (SCO1/SenC/PrrC family)